MGDKRIPFKWRRNATKPNSTDDNDPYKQPPTPKIERPIVITLKEFHPHMISACRKLMKTDDVMLRTICKMVLNRLEMGHYNKDDSKLIKIF